VVNVVVIFVLFLFWEFHISWVVVLTINPSLYVELVTFCISEWLAAFSSVIFFYFVVLFDEAVETITQVWCKVQQHSPRNVRLEHNVVTCNSVFPA
jgi:hypothetical protein